MKTAIVYDRVNKWGGAERVLLDLNKIFPQADLFTSVYDPENAAWASVFPNVYTSFLNSIAFSRRNHEYFAWAMPLAFERFDLSNYDLVISVTSESAKGVITNHSQKHVCIMLTPNRYIWSGYDQYFKNSLLKTISYPVVKYIRKWDIKSANRPDSIIAISKEVQTRIKKYYQRDSKIIYPSVSKLKSKKTKRLDEQYYLIVSRLVAYKKVDLVIEAFNQMQKKLYVVGTGREENYLKNIANSNVKFLGNVLDEDLANLYYSAEAVLFPQLEDFGIVPVESQLYGTPVIAYRGGGALETIIEGQTGIFFDSQTKEGIIDAINIFDSMEFDRNKIIKNAEKYSFERFKKELLKEIENV